MVAQFMNVKIFGKGLMKTRPRAAVLGWGRSRSRGLTSECDTGYKKKGLVVGAYDGTGGGDVRLTSTAVKFDEECAGKLRELVRGAGIKLGKARVFHNLGNDFYAVAVAGLGPDGIGYNPYETINDCKENVRIAAATGARALQDMGATTILVEGFTSTEAAAEGSSLAVWKFQEYKYKLNWTTVSKVELYEDSDRENWERGSVKAEAQNIARKLEDTPANVMTPSVFAQKAIEILCPCGVQVEVRDREWLEAKKMTAFLSVARGSCEPPLFLEVAYCGGSQEEKPVVLTGKGVTFDSGGVCLRSCEGMSEYRADMAGAAVCVGTFKGLAQLNVPMNCNGLIPLCENMPGGMAMKPGDVVLGVSGKSIRLEDTSKEGRVILSDAISYTCQYKPCLVINVATLSSGMRVAVGSACTGVFTTSDVVYQEMSRAGAETGDRVWRFPLWKHFLKRVHHYDSADLNNVGAGRGGDPCIGAAFLADFGPQVDFLHLDITGTGRLSSDLGPPYLREGTMTGRPTRTLIQFLYQMACPHDKGD